MPIVSSVIVEDRPQRDSRRFIRERHMSDLGEIFHMTYLAEADVDANAQLASRAAQIDAQLVEGEHSANLFNTDTGDSPRFRYTTQAQFLIRLTAFYRASSGLTACRIGRWFHLANLSDAVLRNLFGITTGQVAGLRTKFSNQNSLLVSVSAETGVYP